MLLPKAARGGEGLRLMMLLACLSLLLLAGCHSTSEQSSRPSSSSTASPARWSGIEDVSPHNTRFVEVDPGVQLEVLDWGGSGEAMVLLAGLGDNAHVYDDFAGQFTDRFRVIGITRRGFGRSSRPEAGYDLSTRARDDMRVLDELEIDKATFVGHSFAGDELSQLGAHSPERVVALVYLDALDYGGYAELEQPPLPAYSPADVASVARFADLKARLLGTRPPLSSLRDQYVFSGSGGVVGIASPPEISKKLIEGSRQAEYDRITAPVLAVFAPLSGQVPQPFYDFLSPAQKADYQRTFPLIIDWQTRAIDRLRQGVKNVEVLERPGANHYLFINDKAFVTSAIREFLKASRTTS